MRFAFGILTVLACGVLVPVAPLGAQDRDSRPNRPWVVEISRGIPSGYAGTGVEQAMRRAGLDETTPFRCGGLFGGCGGPDPHPRTYRGGEGRQIAVARRLPPRFEVRVRYMAECRTGVLARVRITMEPGEGSGDEPDRPGCSAGGQAPCAGAEAVLREPLGSAPTDRVDHRRPGNRDRVRGSDRGTRGALPR